MGFSPGEFKSLNPDIEFHWEGSPRFIKLWKMEGDSIELVLALDQTNAEEALAQLELLVGMLQAKAL